MHRDQGLVRMSKLASKRSTSAGQVRQHYVGSATLGNPALLLRTCFSMPQLGPTHARGTELAQPSRAPSAPRACWHQRAGRRGMGFRITVSCSWSQLASFDLCVIASMLCLRYAVGGAGEAGTRVRPEESEASKAHGAELCGASAESVFSTSFRLCKWPGAIRGKTYPLPHKDSHLTKFYHA